MGCKFANIQIAEDVGFTNNLIDGSKLSTSDVLSYSLPSPEQLKGGTKYYWRVRLAFERDESGNHDWSDWSETWSFTTLDPISVDEIINGFQLEEAMPNPANNYVEISFNLENESVVSLDLFNSNGELIQNIINSERKNGLNKYRVNTEELSAGIYFYTIKVNGTLSTKRFVIVR